MDFIEKTKVLDEITQDVLGTAYEELRTLMSQGFLDAGTLNRYLQAAGSRIVIQAIAKKVVE